jgi:hypothetical protein
VIKVDIWDVDFSIAGLRRLVSIDRVRGSVRYSRGRYATDEDLERDRKKVSDRLSKTR